MNCSASSYSFQGVKLKCPYCKYLQMAVEKGIGYTISQNITNCICISLCFFVFYPVSIGSGRFMYVLLETNGGIQHNASPAEIRHNSKG